jgi:hypothetical protein
MGEIKNIKQLQSMPGGDGVYAWLVRNSPELLYKHLPSHRDTYANTLEKCKNIASLYETRSAWKLGHPSSYKRTCESGWLEECSRHMTNSRKIKNTYTLDFLKEDALKYKTRVEWNIKSKACYVKASKLGYLDDCCAHMRNDLGGTAKPVKNLNTGEIFTSSTRASHSINAPSSAVSQGIRRGNRVGGYHWAYCDENGNILK